MEYKLLKDRRGVNIKLAFFALIAVSVIILASGTIIDDWNDEYNSGLTYDLDEEYDQLDNVANTAKDQRSDLSVKSSAQDTNDFEGTSIRGAFGILSTIHDSFDAVFGDGGMIEAIEKRWKMPPYIRLAIITAMSTALLFTVISIIFGRRKT